MALSFPLALPHFFGDLWVKGITFDLPDSMVMSGAARATVTDGHCHATVYRYKIGRAPRVSDVWPEVLQPVRGVQLLPHLDFSSALTGHSFPVGRPLV